MLNKSKKSLRSILFVLLIGFVIFTLLFLTLSVALMFENVNSSVHPYLRGVINEKFSPTQIDKFYDTGTSLCRTGLKEDFVFQTSLFQNKSFPPLSLTCEELSRYNNETLVDALISKAVYRNYYEITDLKCNGLSCMKTFLNNPLVLISKKAQDFFLTNFIIFLFISVLLLFWVFLLFEDKNGFFVYLGTLLIITSLAMFLLYKMNFFFNISDALFLKMISILFSQSKTILFSIFGLGIVSVVFGKMKGFSKLKDRMEKS